MTPRKFRVVRRTYWKPIKQGDAWYIVSTIYEPPRLGSVGSGIFICTPHKTRALARARIAEMRAGK